MAELKEIKIEKIIFSKTNPRTNLDNDGVPDLAVSIKNNKLYQPVLLRKLGKKYECVDGERRIKAHKLLKRKSINSLIDDFSDDQVREIQLISFIQKKDLHPLSEAEAINGLLETGKYTVETIAEKLGKPSSYVASRHRLITLVPEARKAFAENRIELGHAILICKMPESEQQRIWKHLQKNYLIDDPVNYRTPRVSDLKSFITDNSMVNLNTVPFNRKDKLLLAEAGSCFECPKRTGNAQDLFDEFSGKNICPDKKCYCQKIDLHIEQAINRSVDEGKVLIKLSRKFYDTKKDVIGWGQFEVTKEGKNVMRGIYVDGEEKGKCVSIILKEEKKETESANKAEDSSPRSELNEPTDKEKLALINEKIKKQREEAFTNAVTEALLALTLDEFVLVPILKTIFCNPDFEVEDFFDYEVSPIIRTTSNLYNDVMKMPEKDFIEVFNRSAIVSAANGAYGDTFLLDLAKGHGINIKEIRKTVDGNLPLYKTLAEAEKTNGGKDE